MKAAPDQVIFGRDSEIALIAAALDGVAPGPGRLLVLEGPAGIGKTRLLAAARRMASRRGRTLLSAKATELESTFPYGVVRQLFERPLASAAQADRDWLLQGAAAPSASLLLPGAGSAAGPSGVPLLHSLWWLTANFAARSPLLLTVDDAQWSDEASLRLVAYLANRLDALPALLLLSVRSGEHLPPPLAELVASPSTELLALGPLSEQASMEFLAARLPEPPDPDMAAACFAATHGNPFLLSELARTLAGPGGPRSPAGLSSLSIPAVTRSVLKRLEHLGPEVSALAGAVAVWGEGAELRQAAEVAGIPAEAAAPAADWLSDAGILRPGRPLQFVHPLVQSAVYSNLSPAERSRGHRHVAAILESEAAPVERVAAHLVQTEPAADPYVAGTLLKGAQAALARGAPEAARRYLQRALREPPGRQSLGGVLHSLGVAELRIDPKSAVQHLSDALTATGPLRARARIALDLVTAHLHNGTVGRVEAVVRPELDALYAHDRELALQLEAELLIAHRQGLAQSPLADEGLDRWRGKLRGDTPAERLLLSQIAVRAALTGAPADEVAGLAEAALGGGRLLDDVSSEAVTAYVPLYPLLCADRFDTVHDYLDRAEKDAGDRGSPVGFALASTFRALLSNATGDLRSAEAQAASAIESLTGLRFELLVAGAAEPAVAALVEMGRLEDAEALLERHGLVGPVPDTVPARILVATRGRLRLAQGRISQAMEDLGRLAALERTRGASNLYLVPYQPWLALAMAASGRTEEAREIAQRQVEGARRWGAPRILAHNLAVAARLAAPGDDLALLREAVDLTGGSPARLVRAQALVDLGSALRRSGQRSEAVEVLRHGLDLAHRCGAEALAARARADLVLLGTRPRRPAMTGVEALTPGERRVAEMAAAGLTNRQIAEKLFLTGRTVEHHLTHCYQKLGIASRSELARFFPDPG